MQPARIARPAPRGLLFVLAGAAALGSLAIQMVIPALPAIAHDLAVSPFVAQLTISVYLLGLAVGQLGAGAAADSVGRRPVLLAGIGLFTLMSALAGCAESAGPLLAARFFQAIGGACGLIAGRAIVADTAEGGSSARPLAALSSLLLVSPMIAPTIGGQLTEMGGWRAIFWTLALSGATVSLIALRLVPETAIARPQRSVLGLATLLLGSPRFIRLTLGNGLVAVALYAFLSVAPFVLINRFGQSPREAGLSLLWIAAAAIGGTLLHRSHRLSARASGLGRALALLGAAAFVIANLVLLPSAATLILPMMLIGLGSGLTGPSLLSTALSLERSAIGTASSLFGAAQMTMSALGSTLVAALGITTPVGLGWFLLGVIVVACVILHPTMRTPVAIVGN